MTDLVDMMQSARPLARTSDPITSHHAAAQAVGLAASDCADIYGALRLSRKPMAAEEISDMLGWGNHVRVNRRLKELAEPLTDEYGALIRRALIERTEERHTNRSGRQAFKYRVRQQ